MKKYCWFAFALLLGAGGAWAQTPITLKVAGTEGKLNYQQDLLSQALTSQGYKVTLDVVGEFTGTKLEAMLAAGEINVSVMGETPARSASLLPVKIGMTNNLVGKRILFIPKGAQKDYDGVKTLADFQKLGKVAGMGKGWADVGIWGANKLKVNGLDGDWKVLYKMVAAGSRGVDYLPRGANEMIIEGPEHPELDMEKHLVLVYQKDQILYVSPKEPQLVPIVEKALKAAASSGLIKKLVKQYYSAAFDPPIDVDTRTVIDLTLP
jgi:hypothetical protein